MRKCIKAKVYKETPEGTYFSVLVPKEYLSGEIKKLSCGSVLSGELRIDDGRTISAEQRKKIYATLDDIAAYTGHSCQEVKAFLMHKFIDETREKSFLLSNCSMSIARDFTNYILNFVMEWGIPLKEKIIERTGDSNVAIYSSLSHKRCIVCGRSGEIHHWDAIGAGRNSKHVNDSALRKLCLCRVHHTEAHKIGRDSFEKKYHVHGIVFNED